jgi:5-methylthioribose kinase
MTAVTELSVEYLRKRGFSVEHAEELGGGVSNVVLMVETPGNVSFFKQSLPKLRVADEWLFDQKRIINERKCMEWLSENLPGSAPVVRFQDDENFIFGMSFAPEGGTLWKKALLEGDTDRVAAERVGALLARCTGGPRRTRWPRRCSTIRKFSFREESIRITVSPRRRIRLGAAY